MSDREFPYREDRLARPSRRRILSVSAGALATGLAGCTGTENDGSDATPADQSEETGTPTETPTEEETSTPTETPTETQEVETTSEDEADVVGSLDDCVIEQATGSIDPIPVTVDGRNEDAPVTLDLRWNARTQISAADSPDEYSYTDSDEDEKLQIFKIELTNGAEEGIFISKGDLALEYETPDIIDETLSDLVGLDDAFESVTIKSGSSYEGILVFTVPQATTSAVLVPNQVVASEQETAFNPSCDRSFSLEVYDPDASDE